MVGEVGLEPTRLSAADPKSAAAANYATRPDGARIPIAVGWTACGCGVRLQTVGHYTFSVHVDAPPEHVFALWTNLGRMGEWVGGVTWVTDISGPVDQVGTRFTVQFGKMSSTTEVIAVERPRLFRTRFGNRILRGESQALFEPDGTGTRVTQEFWTKGVIAAIAARLFATGSYKGSFRGELHEFARIASAQARQAA